MRFEKLQGVEVARKALLAQVADNYATVCQGRDPVSGKAIYVDCITSSGTYRMNAGEKATLTMDGGYRGFAEQGATHMPYVRDFNNNNTPDVPMAVAKQIRDAQFNASAGLHAQKGAMVDAINAATTVVQLRNLPLTFSVNTEE